MLTPFPRQPAGPRPPILLVPGHFGLDAGLLARSLLGYVADPTRREALGRRALEGPAPGA